MKKIHSAFQNTLCETAFEDLKVNQLTTTAGHKIRM